MALPFLSILEDISSTSTLTVLSITTHTMDSKSADSKGTDKAQSRNDAHYFSAAQRRWLEEHRAEFLAARRQESQILIETNRILMQRYLQIVNEAGEAAVVTQNALLEEQTLGEQQSADVEHGTADTSEEQGDGLPPQA